MSLVLDDLHKRYGATRAVDGVSLDVAGDSTLALLGPSGCGKSTTLRLVAGLEPPDRGRVILDDQDITRVPPQKRDFGVVFQDYALFPHLDVAANIAFGLVELGWPRTERARRVAELLELVELEGLERRRIRELSGGQQQRVALARALAPRPRVLLLDEPLSNLDPTLREGLKRELAALLGSLGVRALYVTHDQSEAFALADRIALMRAGRIVQVGDRTTLLERPATAWAARFVGHRNVFDRDAPQGSGVTGPAVLHTERVTLVDPADGPRPASTVDGRVRTVARDGRLWRLEIDVPAWSDARVSWEGFDREVPVAPSVGDDVVLRVPDGAWSPLAVEPESRPGSDTAAARAAAP